MKSLIWMVMSCSLLGLMACGSKKSVDELPSGTLTYQAPDNWIEETLSSAMRQAQFRLPGESTELDAELAVFFFEGSGGSVEANLNRWYGQFNQPDGRPSNEVATTEKRRVQRLSVTIASLTGTFVSSMGGMGMGGPVTERPNYAMLAAIVETKEGSWFFKATGPELTVAKHRSEFDDFVKTFRIRS